MAIIDAILTYNRDRWGGRYNPIVLTNGQTLTNAWWSLLEAVDPNVVKSFVALSDHLVGAIERRVSPYLIQQLDPREQDDGRWHLHLLDDGLSLLPTALNVRMASWTTGESSRPPAGWTWVRAEYPGVRRRAGVRYSPQDGDGARSARVRPAKRSEATPGAGPARSSWASTPPAWRARRLKRSSGRFSRGSGTNTRSW